MSELGQKAKYSSRAMTSAVALIADMSRPLRHVRSVPIATEMGRPPHVRFPPITTDLRTSLEVRFVTMEAI